LFKKKTVIGSSLAYDEFFGDIRRAEIFEKTDFVIPEVTINFKKDDLKNFLLKYQCERDMNVRYLTRNEECYTAPWVDLNYSLNKAFRHQLIDKSLIKTSKDIEIINNNNGKMTVPDFEHIVTTYSNYTLEEILATTYGLIDIPNFEAEEVGLTFNIDGLES